MPSLTPARAALLSGIAVTCAMASIGALIGALMGGPGAAGVYALIAGCAAALGSFLIGRRSLANFFAVRQAALSAYKLMHIGRYGLTYTL
ncbi:hypothetical protein ACFWX8_40305, partial [Streptomyces violascens]